MAAPVARSRLRGNAARRTVNARLEKRAVSRRAAATGSNSVPAIAVTSREPAGVGPDVCLALARKRFAARIVVLGDREMLQSRARQLGLRLRLRDPGSAMTSDSIACLHVPLSYTCRAGTLDRRSAPYVISLLDRAIAGCKAGEFVALTTAPGILVAGLNPHSGEGGYFGREEIEVIGPVLEKLRAEGLRLTGPLPADTVFVPDRLAGADCVLAMYHDQGLPVLKYASFGKGINVTPGLPMIRTSVDHGTAADLAGTGRAEPDSLFAAVEAAIEMARVEARARR